MIDPQPPWGEAQVKAAYRDHAVTVRRIVRRGWATTTALLILAGALSWLLQHLGASPQVLSPWILLGTFLAVSGAAAAVLRVTPGFDDGGEPLELAVASRRHRQLRRMAGRTADPQRRGPILAEAIHGEAIAWCEVDERCGCTIAHLHNGDTITFSDFAHPRFRQVAHVRH